MMQYSPFVLPSLSTLRAGCLFLLYACIIAGQLRKRLLHTRKSKMHGCTILLHSCMLRKQTFKRKSNTFKRIAPVFKSILNEFNMLCEHFHIWCKRNIPRGSACYVLTHFFFGIVQHFRGRLKHFCSARERNAADRNTFFRVENNFIAVQHHFKAFCMTHAPFRSNQKTPNQAPFHVFYIFNQNNYGKIIFLLAPAR